jgi:hypothetical protein
MLWRFYIISTCTNLNKKTSAVLALKLEQACFAR